MRLSLILAILLVAMLAVYVKADCTDGCGENMECVDDVCKCLSSYVDQEGTCVLITCFDYEATSNDVCSGHGNCTDFDTCQCEQGWTANNCSDAITCNKFAPDDEGVCNGRGSCQDLDQCSCDKDYYGNDCQYVPMDECSGAESCNGNGDCLGNNICDCFLGYEGETCSKKADVIPVNFGEECLSLEGCVGFPAVACLSSGDVFTCQCSEGFEELSNATCTPRCYAEEGAVSCSNEGSCVMPDTCKCNKGYCGTYCERECTEEDVSCHGVASDNMNVCSSHGVCSQNDVCSCNGGYSGDECETSVFIEGALPYGSSCTPGVDVCISMHGDCVVEPTSEMYMCACKGYTGDYCEIEEKTPVGQACDPTKKGKCQEGSECIADAENKETGICTCSEGYSLFQDGDYSGCAPMCNGTIAMDVNVCSGRGKCTDFEQCSCTTGFEEDVFYCNDIPFYENGVCSGKGVCESQDVCVCPSGTGTYCESMCQDDCNGHGICDNGQCFCEPGYNTETCRYNPDYMMCTDVPPIEFCADVVNYPIPYVVRNGAEDAFEYDQLFLEESLKMDYHAQIMFNNFTTLACPTKDSKCLSSFKSLVCYVAFNGCGSEGALPMCKSTCDALAVDIPKLSSISIYGKSASCDQLVSEDVANGDVPCFYGAFIPEGTTCNEVPYDSYEACSGNGQCIGPDMCACYYGAGGKFCDLAMCGGKTSEDEKVCSGHGDCVGAEQCECYEGYSGTYCESTSCMGLSENEGGCSFRGSCVETDVCKCDGNYDPDSFCSSCLPGFDGEYCDIPVCFGLRADDPDVCFGMGSCVDGSCVCSNGGAGPYCDQFSCFGKSNGNASVCSGHGECWSPDECYCSYEWNGATDCSKCSPNYKGKNCDEPFCDDQETCHGHGTCVADANYCECKENFAGEFCDECVDGLVGDDCSVTCSDFDNCNGNGKCNKEGKCTCDQRFTGEHCDACTNGFLGEYCDFKLEKNTFSFNKMGDTITGKVWSDVSWSFDCDYFLNEETVESIGGWDAYCRLEKKGDMYDFIINLGPSATIGVDGKLKFWKYPGSDEIVSVNVTKGDFVAVAPNAVLVTDSKIVSKCDLIVLDASESTSLDRRELAFKWIVEKAPSTKSKNDLTNLLEEYSWLFVEASTLDSGDYTVSVSVSSVFTKQSSKATVSFKIVDDSIPTLRMPFGSELRLFVGSFDVAYPDITFPQCYSGSGEVSFTYKLLKEKSKAFVSVVAEDGMLIFGEGYTNVSMSGDYYFEVTAVTDGALDAKITFKVNVAAQQLEGYFDKRDFSQSFEEELSFEFYTSDPSETEDEEVISITCLDQKKHTACNYKSGDMVPAGTYTFTGTVTKGARSASSTLTIKVLDVAKDALVKVSISPGYNYDLAAVDPSSDLVFYANLLDEVEEPSFEWSSASLELKEVDTFNSYIYIPFKSTAAGKTYTLTLKVTDGKKSGTADIKFTVNSPPTKGLLDILPSTGTALSTSFAISCGNGWSDIHLPLSYQFFIEVSENNWQPLNQPSESKSIMTPLPASDALKIKAVVSDAKGASSEVTSTVKVSEISKQAALELLTGTQGTISLASASSALSVLTGITGATESEKVQILAATAKILDSFLADMDKKSAVTKETSETAASKMAVLATASTNGDILNEDTTKKLIEQVSKTLQNVVASEKVKMDASTMQNVEKVVENLLKKIQTGTRKTSKFSSSDAEKLFNTYNNLMAVKEKTAISDMPANTIASAGVFAYSRKLKRTTLNGLAEKIGSSLSFNLTSTFGNSLSTSGDVFVKVRSVPTSASSLIASGMDVTGITSEIVEFNVFTPQMQVVPFSMNTPQVIIRSFKRSIAGSSTSCVKYDATTKKFVAATGCTIVDGSTLAISSNGVYAVKTTTAAPTPSTGGNTGGNTGGDDDGQVVISAVAVMNPTMFVLALIACIAILI